MRIVCLPVFLSVCVLFSLMTRVGKDHIGCFRIMCSFFPYLSSASACFFCVNYGGGLWFLCLWVISVLDFPRILSLGMTIILSVLLFVWEYLLPDSLVLHF